MLHLSGQIEVIPVVLATLQNRIKLPKSAKVVKNLDFIKVNDKMVMPPMELKNRRGDRNDWPQPFNSQPTTQSNKNKTV